MPLTCADLGAVTCGYYAEPNGPFTFYSPEEFLQKRRGEKQDFAIFLSDALNKRGYESSMILQYQYVDGKRNTRPEIDRRVIINIKVETLVLFRDRNRAPKYIFFQDGKLALAEYDGIIGNLLAAEEERLNIEILRHNFSRPGFIHLIRQEE